MSRTVLPARDQGFALVEALASLVIVGMIALMLSAGATTGRRVWEGIDRRESAGEELENAQAALRDRVEQIYPATLYQGNPPTVDFQGTPGGLSFLASPFQAERPAPLRRYTLVLDATGDLNLESVSDVGPPETAPVYKQTLLKGVREIDVAYFGRALPDMQRRWRPSWRNQAGLPEAVRMRLVFEPGDPRQWPDLVIRTRTTIDAACLLNTATHHCKGRA